MSMDIDDSQASSSSVPSKPVTPTKTSVTAAKNTREIDPVQTAWPKMKNPEPGTVAAAPAPIKTSPPANSATAASTAAASLAGPSKATTGPNIPAGPGHKLGDGSSTGRGR